MKKIWIINGTGDGGNWEIEAFETHGSAKKAFIGYISEFGEEYPDAVWDIDLDDDSASYEAGNHFDSFRIEEITLRK